MDDAGKRERLRSTPQYMPMNCIVLAAISCSGFDEQSVLASDYHILTLEPRYLLSRNAYAGVFTDVELDREPVVEPRGE